MLHSCYLITFSAAQGSKEITHVDYETHNLNTTNRNKNISDSKHKPDGFVTQQ